MDTTIHIGNLSFKLMEDDLKEYFSKYGKVTDTYVVRRGGRPRGYGFVEFDSSKAANNALEANGLELDGRNINIEKAKGKIVKSNFSDNDFRGNFRGNFRRGPSRFGGPRRFNGPRRYDNGPRDFDNGPRDFDNGPRNYDNRPPRDFDDGPRDFDNSPRDFDNGPRRYNNGPRRYNNGPRDFDNGPRNYDNRPPRDFDNGPRRDYNGPNRFGNRGGPNRRQYTLRQGFGNRGFGQRRNFNNRDNNNNNRPPRNYNRKSNEDKENSATAVYVSNLPFSVDEASLAKIFYKYKVKTTHIVQSMNGRSRGYGFVEFETNEDQSSAIKEMNEAEVKGSDDNVRKITVKVALVDKQKVETTTTSETKD